MFKKSTMDQLLRKSDQPLHLCVSFVLLWIASSDGDIDHSEREFIFAHMEMGSHNIYDNLVDIINDQKIDNYLIVCKILMTQLDASKKELFLSLAIGVSIADNRLAISENHVLRFLADVMNYSPVKFNALYKNMTGSSFPDPGDPSSIQWWKSKSTNKNKQYRESNKSESKKNKTFISKVEAHVILGVQQNASVDDIKRAYKRLVQSHHPDRFSSLGPEAEEAAHQMFIRIQSAYKVLMK